MPMTKSATESSLMLGVLVVLVCYPATAFAQMPDQAYIFCFPGDVSSQILSSYFGSKSGLKITEYDLRNLNATKEFQRILDLLVLQGVEVLPRGKCIPCLLSKLSLREVYEGLATPLVGLFFDGSLKAIAIAVTDSEILDQAFLNTNNGLKVFTQQETFTLTDDARINLQEAFDIGQREPNINPDIASLLPLIVMAATVDAVNPCEFYVLTVLLSFVFFRTGRKTVLKAGIAYSVALFIIYFLMGLGLWKIIGYVQEARLFVVILGFAVGLRAVLNFIFGVFGLSLGLRDAIGVFMGRRIKRVPESFSKRLSSYLVSASESPYGAFAVGIVASAFLLPCTSGPYLIALSLIANLETLLDGLFLLTIYNSIIIAPFLAITLGIYMLKIKTGELKRWSSKGQKWLNLVAGLLMIFLSLYLISTLLV